MSWEAKPKIALKYSSQSSSPPKTTRLTTIWWLTSPCYSLWSLSGLMLCGYDVSEKCPKAENEHFIDCRWNCCSWNCEWMHLQIASTLPHFEIASTLPHFADCSTVQCLHINTLQIALPCSMPRRSHSSLRAPPVAQVLGMVFSSSDFNAFLETVTVLALNTTTTLMPGLLGGKLIGNAGRRFWNTDHCFLITLCQVQVYIEKDSKCAIKSMWCWKLEVAAEYLQVYCFTRVVG